MTTIFCDDDLWLAFAQKRRLFRIYFSVLCVFIAIAVACIVFFVSLPFRDALQIVPKTAICVATCLFIVFSHIFLGIKYKRVNTYYKTLAGFSAGIKTTNRSIFLRYDGVTAKDGVDCYVLIFSEWSKKKSCYLDRKIYSDKEKPCPQFKVGDEVRYITHGNIMLCYEISGRDESFEMTRSRQQIGL